MNRNIEFIAIHCTATNQSATIPAILNYWKNELGWKNPGYHFIIEPTGKITQLQPLDKASNGVRGYNKKTINIAYIGGIDRDGETGDTRTGQQYLAMAGLIKGLHGCFPNAKVLGHRDFPNVKKECPCFEVKDFVKQIEL